MTMLKVYLILLIVVLIGIRVFDSKIRKSQFRKRVAISLVAGCLAGVLFSIVRWLII